MEPLEQSLDGVDSENFTFLSPFSNLDLYPSMDHPPYFDTRRCPTMLDVIKVKRYLSFRVPTEIIDILLDLAEYWPHTSSILDMTTRVYYGHMNYGSHGRGPKTWWHNRSSTPEMRREWQEIGFVLRTPPLGLRCVQSDDPRKGYLRSLLRPPRAGTDKKHDWLPPRGKHPARAILFEILSREERPGSNLVAGGLRQDPRTSFEATVDKVRAPENKDPSAYETLYWTTEAATTKNYQSNTTTFNPDTQYKFQPRQSSSANPELTQTFPIYQNRTAQNTKCVVAYRYDDTTPFSAERGRFLSGDIVRGFIRGLKEGDSIALWAKADEGSPCCNVIDRVKIHVFWAV